MKLAVMADEVLAVGESTLLAAGFHADCAFERLLARVASPVHHVLAVIGESARAVWALEFGFLVSVVGGVFRGDVSREKPFGIEADIALLACVCSID